MNQRYFLSMLLGVISSAAPAIAVQFAVIGDYGVDDPHQAEVASTIDLVVAPQLILTTGDNNYLGAGLSNWDNTQGKYYSAYIQYPAGSSSAYAGNGVTQNNFFPSLGNHDWDADVNEYTDYFNLPGNERYYKFTRDNVEFFILSSDEREPDGRDPGTTQYEWAKTNIQNSTARWQLVFYHHPAWTSISGHDAELAMRWDYKDWGVDAVFTGHNHHMESLDVDGLPYFIIGSSGNELYPVTAPPQGATSLYVNDTQHGFAVVESDPMRLTVSFLNSSGTILNTTIIPEPSGLFWILICAGIMKRSRASVRC